jgi:Pyruvate/2-oxoacid:ferredoxin oxidoreductase delta subunit
MHSQPEMQSVSCEQRPAEYKQFAVVIDEDACSKCRICISMCECFWYDAEREIVRVNATSCKGCGMCLSACPSSAIEHVYGDGLVYGVIDGEIDEAFACSRCRYDHIEEKDAIVFCSKRFDMGASLERISSGKKVVVKPCLFSDAKTEEHDERIRQTKDLLSLMGMADWLQVV